MHETVSPSQMGHRNFFMLWDTRLNPATTHHACANRVYQNDGKFLMLPCPWNSPVDIDISTLWRPTSLVKYPRNDRRKSWSSPQLVMMGTTYLNLCKLFHRISQNMDVSEILGRSLKTNNFFETYLTQHHYHHSSWVCFETFYMEVLKQKQLQIWSNIKTRLYVKELYLAMLSPPSNSGEVEGL